MDERTVRDLDAILARMERGEQITSRDLQTEFPESHAVLSRALGLDARLGAEADPSRLERVGPFHVLYELGRGGTGTVYLAVAVRATQRVRRGTRVAIKILHEHLSAEHESVRMFLREAALGFDVRHPNLVRTLDTGTVRLRGRPRLYLAAEYVEGQTLRDFLQENGPLAESLCRGLAEQVAAALDAIHSGGVVHGDVKPDNIIVTEDGKVRLTDFGTAQLAGAPEAMGFAGSLPYAAPEQIDGRGNVDGRADLYALGLTLFELATGRHSDANTGSVGTDSELSPSFRSLLESLLARAPKDRVGTARELLDDLQDRRTAVPRRTGLARARVPRQAPLIGRGSEMSTLQLGWERARRGDGGLALLEGEAGIGKSRLVEEFLETTHPGEFLRLAVSFSPAATTADAIWDELRSHQGLARDAPATAQLYDTEPRFASALAALLGWTPREPTDRPPTPDFAATALICLLRIVARSEPVLWVIEDLHFADTDGLALVHALGAAFRNDSVYCLCTTRTELPETEGPSIAGLPHCTRIPVDRLQPSEGETLVRLAAAPDRVEPQAARLLADRSGGVPFLLLESLREMQEDGSLVRMPTRVWSFGKDRDLGAVPTPPTFRSLVQRRLQRLAAPEIKLLELAACAGFAFDPSLVTEAARTNLIAGLRDLARIQARSHCVRPSETGYTFDHHAIHESVYAGIPRKRRRVRHRALAHVLEARAPAPARRDAVELVRHWTESDEPNRALRHLDTALGFLEPQSNQAAARMLRQVLSRCDGIPEARRLALTLRHAHILGLLGRRTEAEQALEAVLSAPEAEVRHQAEALVQLAESQFRRGLADEAAETSRRAAERARSAGLATSEIRAMTLLGDAHYQGGRIPEARRHLVSAVTLAREVGDVAGELRSLASLGQIALANAEFDESLTHYEGVRARAAEASVPMVETHALGHLAIIHRIRGEYSDAMRLAREALRTAQAVGFRRAEAELAGQLAQNLHALGRYAEAKTHYERMWHLAFETSSRRAISGAQLHLGELYALFGNRTRGLEYSRKAMESSVDEQFRASILFVWGDMDRWDEPSQAEAFYEEAAQRFQRIRMSEMQAAALVGIGAVRCRRGQTEEARAVLTEAQRLAAPSGVPRAIVLGAAYESGLDPSRRSEALALLRRHDERLPLLTRIEARFVLWEAGTDSGLLEEAYRLLLTARDGVPQEYATAFLGRVTFHRRIVDAYETRIVEKTSGPRGHDPE